MHKVFIIFLLFFQLFFINANAVEINYSAQKLNQHIEYIKNQTVPKKRISIDFKNYENAILNLNTNKEEIFSLKYNRSFEFFLATGFNSVFNSNFINLINTSNNIYSESNNIFSCLKNEINTRAP